MAVRADGEPMGEGQVHLVGQGPGGERPFLGGLEVVEVHPQVRLRREDEGELHGRVLQSQSSGVDRDVQEVIGKPVKSVVGGEEGVEDTDLIVVGILVPREVVVPEGGRFTSRGPGSPARTPNM